MIIIFVNFLLTIFDTHVHCYLPACFIYDIPIIMAFQSFVPNYIFQKLLKLKYLCPCPYCNNKIKEKNPRTTSSSQSEILQAGDTGSEEKK